ncbi:hypothetical protein BOX15_Mlig005335g1 [Macrostomum lignano]|uniref:Uncharacterized protein n=1 Tax=Macrostomum lignano TaxID=282301 RepID=A0A267E2I2_9PLAT|nr:hypothetical protein BOX15_Mlig005335g3 [Macrostomum lignano]PAA55761.1 hypothetical protein BOX15_Mlig005335g1 [Macrostomum lignano]
MAPTDKSKVSWLLTAYASSVQFYSIKYIFVNSDATLLLVNVVFAKVKILCF